MSGSDPQDPSFWRDHTGLAELPETKDVTLPRGPGVLVVLAGHDVGRTHIIHESVVIGRDEAADIQIDRNDISRRHAAIELRESGEFVLRDLGSRNGTYLNGVGITEEPLKFGDHIGIGPRATLLFALFEPVSEEIQQRQRVESLGRLASGVAHDFNNMLAVIIGGIDLVLNLPGSSTLDAHEVRECLVDALAAARKSCELTAQILSFARGRSGAEMELLDVSKLVGEVLRLAHRTLGASIEIRSSIENDLHVIGDKSQLTQVLMNLSLNARDAMPSGGRLTVECKAASKPEAGPAEIEVIVGDTGTGMDEATRRKAFEPFFTTKPPGKGTGLGLSIVSGIIRNHGGRIALDSAPGTGTTFTISLPMAMAARDDRHLALRRGPRTIEGGKGAVLIVDDEELQLRTTRRLIETLGHHALVAHNRSEALSLFRQNRKQIEIVLLDLVMPDGGGEAIYRALKTIDPNVRVLACSGYSGPERTRKILDLGARGFLQKPYDRQALEVALMKALG
jgi:signal transduction histidine kinase